MKNLEAFLVRGLEVRALARQYQCSLLFAMPGMFQHETDYCQAPPPCVSTLCLPDVTAYDQISQAFPLHIYICILQVIKCQKWERPGKEATCASCCSFHKLCAHTLPGNPVIQVTYILQ